jgi:N-acyl homoserine lactone hydrolase
MLLAALTATSPKDATAASSEAPAGVRLYALDCGTLQFKDMRLFSDTGEYDGQTATIVAPCFLIRHPKGSLMWDTGIDPSRPPATRYCS